jgi:hypothetical protein
VLLSPAEGLEVVPHSREHRSVTDQRSEIDVRDDRHGECEALFEATR